MKLNRILATLALAAVATSSWAQTTLKLGHAQSGTSAFQAGAVAFADEFAKLRRGQVEGHGLERGPDIDKSKFQTALAPAYAEYAKKFGAEAIQRIRDVKSWARNSETTVLPKPWWRLTSAPLPWRCLWPWAC